MQIHPPDLAGFAAFLAERFECSQLVSLGDAPIEFPDYGPQPSVVRYSGAESGSNGFVFAPRWEPGMASMFRELMHRNPAGLVGGRPGEEAAIEAQLADLGFPPAVRGHTRDAATEGATRTTPVFVVENPGAPVSRLDLRAPKDFSVVAFVIVFNEEDVIVPTLLDLFEQGVEAYVIDNWSQDATYDLAREFVGRGVLGIERSPADGPPEYFDLKALLTRVEELVPVLGADWYLKHDADEARRSPWPGVTLRDAFWIAQQAGYNVADFTVANFRPVDDSFVDGSSFVDHFPYFEFGKNPGHFRQLKAWRYFGQELDYARYGSHRIVFPGLRILPYKFLVRHYPVRSQRHGEKKIFQERQARFLPEARQRGWHKQYDEVTTGHSFLEDPATLIRFDEAAFNDTYLIERLSGVGLERLAPAKTSGQAATGS